MLRYITLHQNIYLFVHCFIYRFCQKKGAQSKIAMNPQRKQIEITDYIDILNRLFYLKFSSLKNTELYRN